MYAQIVSKECVSCRRLWDSDTYNLQEHEEYDVCRECWKQEKFYAQTQKDERIARLLADEEFLNECKGLGPNGCYPDCIPDNAYGCACKDGAYHRADKIIGKQPSYWATPNTPAKEWCNAVEAAIQLATHKT